MKTTIFEVLHFLKFSQWPGNSPIARPFLGRKNKKSYSVPRLLGLVALYLMPKLYFSFDSIDFSEYPILSFCDLDYSELDKRHEVLPRQCWFLGLK